MEAEESEQIVIKHFMIFLQISFMPRCPHLDVACFFFSL